jgi:nitrogen fixation/metabolism regulation signal transduction histidine kinase
LAETTKTIKNEVNRLTRLLDEFVRFARMSAPSPQLIRLPDLLESVAALYRPQIESRRLIWPTDVPADQIMLDADRIRQVLVNLIKNGLEVAEDSIVTLTVALDTDRLLIVIHDNGPGFPAAMLDNSFEPQVSQKSDGYGLGLVICQRIIHDHGGRIRLANNPRGGARVEIELPRRHG